MALLHEIFVFDSDLVKSLKKNTYLKSTTELVLEIMKALNMKPLGKLEIYWATDKTAPGWSFIQPITTSHISGHYFEKPGRFPHIHIDIYSCKKFSYKKVISILDKHLQLKTWSGNFVVRNTSHASRKVCGIEGMGNKLSKEHCLIIKK